jgi:DNA polymerase
MGRAGKLSNELLQEIFISRKNVFISNIIKCRPTNNKDPLPLELKSCSPYLDKQIKIFNPMVIVTLRKIFSIIFFTFKNNFICKESKKILGKKILFPVYHPAAALRNPKFAEILRKDFQMIPNLLVDSLRK